LDDIVQEFLVESNENLDRLESELVKLEADPKSSDLLASIFRSIHSIKGACGFLGFNKLQALAHAGESLLGKLRDGVLLLTPEISSALLTTGDAIRQMLAAISTTGQDGEEAYNDLIGTLKRLLEADAVGSAAEPGRALAASAEAGNRGETVPLTSPELPPAAASSAPPATRARKKKSPPRSEVRRMPSEVERPRVCPRHLWPVRILPPRTIWGAPPGSNATLVALPLLSPPRRVPRPSRIDIHENSRPRRVATPIAIVIRRTPARHIAPLRRLRKLPHIRELHATLRRRGRPLRKRAPRRRRTSVVRHPIDNVPAACIPPDILSGDHRNAVPFQSCNPRRVNPRSESTRVHSIHPRVDVGFLFGQHAAAFFLIEKDHRSRRKVFAFRRIHGRRCILPPQLSGVPRLLQLRVQSTVE